MDLRQYFTKIGLQLEECSVEYMLYKLFEILPAEMFRSIEENILTDNYWFINAFDCELNELETLNNHFCIDLCGYNVFEMLFSCYLGRNGFTIHEIESTMEYLYDEHNEKFVDICEEIPSKLKKHVNEFYNKAISECTHDGEYDDYIAQTIDFRVLHIVLKNKSLGRKLRKLYTQHTSFYRLMNEIDIYMEQGEFMWMGYAWTETEGFYSNYFDPQVITNSMQEVRNIMEITGLNNMSGLTPLFNTLLEEDGSVSIVSELLSIHDTLEEVII